MAPRFPKAPLHQATLRLQMAVAAFDRLFPFESLDGFRIAWSDFLSNAGAVIHSLEAGSKKTPQLRQWYGGVRRQTNNDSFLRYMYHARNADEHNADRSIGVRVPGLQFPAGIFEVDGPIHMTSEGILLPPSALISVEGTQIVLPAGSAIALWNVRDERHGDVYEVPSHHNGEPIDRFCPPQFAALYLKFLSDIVKEAESL